MSQLYIFHPLIWFLVVMHKMDECCDEYGHKSLRNHARIHNVELVSQMFFFCLQAFQKEDIDPLQVQLQDISSTGQGLIQTAANGTSTKKLEDDLEEVNAKWNTLNKKVVFILVHAIKRHFKLDDCSLVLFLFVVIVS